MRPKKAISSKKIFDNWNKVEIFSIFDRKKTLKIYKHKNLNIWISSFYKNRIVTAETPLKIEKIRIFLEIPQKKLELIQNQKEISYYKKINKPKIPQPIIPDEKINTSFNPANQRTRSRIGSRGLWSKGSR